MQTQLINQLSELVAEESVSSTNPNFDCGNRAVIDKLANWLEAMGFDCQVQELEADKPKANLIATLSGEGSDSDLTVTGEAGLVMAGHTDTVPYNANLWHQEPLTLTEREGNLYALGATDMKGFFPTTIAAIEQLLEQKGKPLKPITIVATADEECTMHGARMLEAKALPKPSYAIIGEPTELKPIRMHKGIMMNAIRVQGKSGHSSNPDLGLNAMEVMHNVIQDLLMWRSSLQQRYRNPMFAVAFPTMNLGCIHGGDNPNRICGNCYMEFDLRPLPGMNNDDLIDQVNALLQPIAERYQCEISLTKLVEGVEAFEQSCHSRLVQYVEELSSVSSSVAFATEAPFMQQLGMETLVWGPGSIDQAHSANEFIAYSQMEQAVRLYSKLIDQLCY